MCIPNRHTTHEPEGYKRMLHLFFSKQTNDAYCCFYFCLNVGDRTVERKEPQRCNAPSSISHQMTGVTNHRGTLFLNSHTSKNEFINLFSYACAITMLYPSVRGGKHT